MPETKRINDIFSSYKPEEAGLRAVGEAEVLDLKMDRGRRLITLEVSLNGDVPRRNLREYEKGAALAYGLSAVELHVHFSPESFGVCCYPGLVEELKRLSPVVNGFFDGSECHIDGGTLTIVLAHGGRALLLGEHCDRKLSHLIFQEYGLHFEVAVEESATQTAQREAAAAGAPGLPMKTGASDGHEPPAAPARRAEKPRPEKLQAGSCIFGRTVKGKPQPISDVTEASGHVVISGDVFGVEFRETRDGSKYIISFNVTDYQASMAVKIIGEKEKTNCARENLKNGITVVVSGDATYDKYDRDLVVRARDVCTLKKTEKTDDAAVKRVELHLHTTMSALDAVTPATEFVKRAAAWGHTAIAITDHGVVQAFPDAMNTARKLKKEGKPVKIIYGVEDYFIDDTVPPVTGSAQMAFEGEFIAFDLETTGLGYENDRITEIGAVRIVGGIVTDSFDTFVNPHRHIPAEITQLTSITDAMVADAPDEDEAVRLFLEFCGAAVLVAHNAAFDTGFIKAACRRCGMKFDSTFIDTIPLCRVLLPELKKYKLDIVAEHLALPAFQ
ncbi:MAG: exonuclease domain-containing protein, partial [Clostridia bacterium]|nr:exonuclease domain-containing protein [Clostridia bacterium]